MSRLDPASRLNVVMYQIVPAIINNPDKEFQTKQLDAHENVANQLNEICKNPVSDLNQFFADAREQIRRNDKDVNRIKMATTT